MKFYSFVESVVDIIIIIIQYETKWNYVQHTVVVDISEANVV